IDNSDAHAEFNVSLDNIGIKRRHYNVSSGSAVTTGDQSLEEAVNAEARKIANDDKYKWLPVGKVGVNFFW
ncbi:hypothetical protein PCS98_11930, partial [Acinetobacter baumannii]|nr:hypothetical protein [Acinetobacter baumannii]